MPILALLLAVLVVIAARLSIEQSDYVRRHAKSLPPAPLGL
jgi:hypothetical protein